MDGILPFVVIGTAPKEKRSRIAVAMLPGLVPVAAAQRAAVAAVAADQVVRAADHRQEQAVADSISAVQTVIAKPDGAKTLTDDDLAGLPTLHDVLTRDGVGTDLRARLETVGQTVDRETGAFAAEATGLVSKAIELKGKLLSDDDLKGSRLGRVIAADPDLRGRIVTPSTPTPGSAGGGGGGAQPPT